MRQQRWFPIAALAVGLFAINVVTRLVIRIAFNHDDGVQSGASIAIVHLPRTSNATWPKPPSG